MPSHKPMSERLLLPNYLFAMEAYEGFVFGRVVRRRLCKYRPYPLIDSNGSAVDLAPVTHQSELRFRDPRNTQNDILYLDTPTDAGYPWFMHGSIGMKPNQIQMYLRYPEGKDICGKFPSLDPIRPTDGNDFGYIKEEDSPFADPSDAAELVIPPMTHIAAEYYNKDPVRTINPVLNLDFAIYWVDFFSPEQDKEMIRKIARREVPATYLYLGFGNNPMELGDKMTKSWQVTPKPLWEMMK